MILLHALTYFPFSHGEIVTIAIRSSFLSQSITRSPGDAPVPSQYYQSFNIAYLLRHPENSTSHNRHETKREIRFLTFPSPPPFPYIEK
jgi:hypothetical protein